MERIDSFLFQELFRDAVGYRHKKEKVIMIPVFISMEIE
jgi:hypothetical protein